MCESACSSFSVMRMKKIIIEHLDFYRVVCRVFRAGTQVAKGGRL